MVGDSGWVDLGVDRLFFWYFYVIIGLLEVLFGNVLFNFCFFKCSCFGGRRIKKIVK